jgi:hypothetical protein
MYSQICDQDWKVPQFIVGRILRTFVLDWPKSVKVDREAPYLVVVGLSQSSVEERRIAIDDDLCCRIAQLAFKWIVEVGLADYTEEKDIKVMSLTEPAVDKLHSLGVLGRFHQRPAWPEQEPVVASIDDALSDHFGPEFQAWLASHRTETPSYVRVIKRRRARPSR